MIDVTVRAYGALNDFLPPGRRHVAWPCRVAPTTVKDLLEGQGIPHPEVDLVLIDGDSTGFDVVVQDGARIAAYPRFTGIDVVTVTRVRPPDPAVPGRFVADVHLGALARRLRLLGFDTWYDRAAADADLAERAAGEGRALLTRDVGLLKRRIVTHGYFVRSTRPSTQVREVLQRFPRLVPDPLSRCTACNGPLGPAPAAAVERCVPPRARAAHRDFRQCGACGRVYWRGAHWPRLGAAIDAALGGGGA